MNLLQPPRVLLMLPVKPDFMLCEFQMKTLAGNKKRASEPKSAQTVTLTLGDGSHSSCSRAVSLRTKTRTGYITVADTKATGIHLFIYFWQPATLSPAPQIRVHHYYWWLQN